MKRIFAAIKIIPGEEFMKLYYALQNGCKYDRINWVDPKNIHVTLKFFGETPAEKIPLINEALQDVADRHDPFRVVLAGTGVFGSHYKPRVIWVGIEEQEALVKLGLDVLKSMEHIGFSKDRQNFVPHLTLGRIKNTDNKDRFFDLIERHKNQYILDLKVTEFHLYESKLSSSGPTYTVLNTFSIGPK